MTDLTLTVRKLIPAPPERVYGAWLDPRTLAKFMRPGSGMTVPECETEPRVGGRYRIVMRADDNDIPHSGTYLDLTPYSRIAFTWESPFSVEGSTVTLDFAPQAGGTMVTLTHNRFANEGARDNHRSGWGVILDILATAIA